MPLSFKINFMKKDNEKFCQECGEIINVKASQSLSSNAKVLLFFDNYKSVTKNYLK